MKNTTKNHDEETLNKTSWNLSSKRKPRSLATNPFLIFLQDYRQYTVNRGIDKINSAQLACKAGAEWRQMTPEDKLSYIVWARKNKSINEFKRLKSMCINRTHRISDSRYDQKGNEKTRRMSCERQHTINYIV